MRDIALALLDTASLHEVHTAIMHVQHRPQAAVHFRKLFEDRGVLLGRQSQPTVCLGHETVKQVMLPEFGAQHVERDQLVALDLWHEWVDLVPQKIFTSCK